MSIRDLFSANLRELCKPRGTLARITRETGIGRVQLHRYLNGTIPNDENLAALAGFFQMGEVDLFQKQAPPVSDRFGEILQLAKPVIRQMCDELPARIPEGAYYFHFPMPEQSSRVMRSGVFVRRIGNLMTYRSFTREVLETDTVFGSFKSMKRGVVLERYGQFYFIGISARGSKEPAMAVASWLHLSVPLLSGRSIVMHSTTARTPQFLAQRISQSLTTAEVLKGCGAKDISDLENGDLFTRLWAQSEGGSSEFGA